MAFLGMTFVSLCDKVLQCGTKGREHNGKLSMLEVIGLAGKRVSLKKHIEEIKRWAAEGKDDEWIGHALSSTASSVQSFRSRNGIPHYKRSTEATFASLGMSLGSEVFEGVLEEREGRYAIWFDPSVADSLAYKEGWGRLEGVEVRVTPERIVLLRHETIQVRDSDSEKSEHSEAGAQLVAG